MPATRGQMQDALAKLATENPKYREALLKDPNRIVEEQFAMKLPPNFKIKVLTETADTAYVVLPHITGEGELADADLERVAGGKQDGNRCDGNRQYGVGAVTQQIIKLA